MNSSTEIKEIKRKLISSGWSKIINNISITGIHGLNKQKISFQFPICAIVGENGTGKSTILKSLACAYRNLKVKTHFPSDFFPDTIWDNVKDIEMVFQIKQGEDTKIHKITKPTQRWRGLDKRLKNNVYFFDLGRIQAIESLIGYSKLTKKTIKELASRKLLEKSISNLSEIMGRKYLEGRYATTSVDNKKEVGILKFGFGDVSQFHQGTGESIVFDLISTIENIPDYSLVVIDELESSLHPKAQRRLVQQLLYLTRVKTLQIVFSTHSPYILAELPPEARILLTRLNGGIRVFYGPTVDFCLSQIDDKCHYELDVFVEDENSKTMLSEIIRVNNPKILDRIRISPVGAANVVFILEQLYKKKEFPINLIGIVDADCKEMKDILKLPGDFSPEKQLILDICKKSLFGKIAELLNLNTVEVKKFFEDSQMVQDSKQWIGLIATKLNISKRTLFDTLSLIWAKNCLPKEEVEVLCNAILKRLEKIE